MGILHYHTDKLCEIRKRIFNQGQIKCGQIIIFKFLIIHFSAYRICPHIGHTFLMKNHLWKFAVWPIRGYKSSCSLCTEQNKLFLIWRGELIVWITAYGLNHQQVLCFTVSIQAATIWWPLELNLGDSYQYSDLCLAVTQHAVSKVFIT